MMKYLFFAFFCCMFMIATIPRACSEQPHTEQLLGILEQLYQETLNSNTVQHHDHDPKYREEYRQNVGATLVNTLAPIQDAELLGSLAILTWTIAFPGNTGGPDDLFWYTFYLSMEKLAETPSLKNYQILTTIDCHLCLDGGDGLLFRTIMVRQFGKYSGMTEDSLFLREPVEQNHRKECEDTSSRETARETEEELITRINAKIQELKERGEWQLVDANAPRPDITAISPKQERIGEVLMIMKNLQQYARHTSVKDTPNTAIRETVEQILADIHEPEQLSKIASVAWVLSSVDDPYDTQSGPVFYQTYRVCLEKLAADPSPVTYSVLSLLHQCGLCLKEEEQEFFEDTFNNVIQHLKEAGEWPVR